jgi:hypothetical protein
MNGFDPKWRRALAPIIGPKWPIMSANTALWARNRPAQQGVLSYDRISVWLRQPKGIHLPTEVSLYPKVL